MTPFDHYLPFNKYMLDIKNKDVQLYLDQIFSWLITECGFKLLKLDFLYANHFVPSRLNKEADEDLRLFLLRIKRNIRKFIYWDVDPH